MYPCAHEKYSRWASGFVSMSSRKLAQVLDPMPMMMTSSDAAATPDETIKAKPKAIGASLRHLPWICVNLLGRKSVSLSFSMFAVEPA